MSTEAEEITIKLVEVMSDRVKHVGDLNTASTEEVLLGAIMVLLGWQAEILTDIALIKEKL